jgi:phosphoribosyl 1,2-cyclic phosphodiesterase
VTDDADFFVRFWGVRGSIACSGEAYRKYGGNTSCIEVRCGTQLLIFDAGTGLRELGQTFDCSKPLNGNLFLTHTHLDHICGLPFFRPLYHPKTRFRLWAGHLLPERTLHQAICQFMADPLFPVPPHYFSRNVTYHDFKASETLEPYPEIRLRTAPLNHPNGATGYRIEYLGRSICYITDTEHVPGQPDQNILDLVAGSQVMIYDCSYTDAEFSRYEGWGHSTWQEGRRLAEEAGVERLVIFHHDPSHEDSVMDAIAQEAEQARPGTIVAREGMKLSP